MNTLLNTQGGITASTSIIIIFLVVTLFGSVKGLMRGIGRQAVRTVTIIISLVISIYLTGLISASLNTALSGQTVAEMIESSGAKFNITPPALETLILNMDAETLRMIAAVPVAIVALPIIFTLTFVLISAIGELVHIIVSALLRLKMSKNNPATRLLGLILGTLQGVLVAGIILFPFGCFANLSDGMMASIEEGGIKEDSSVMQSYKNLDAYLKDTKENGIIKLVMKLGGSKLQDKFSVVMINGEQTDAKEPFYALAGIFGDYSYLEGGDIKAPSAEEQTVIDGIFEKFTSDDYMAGILSGALKEFALAVKGGRLSINLEEPYGSMLKDAIAVFETSNTENLASDIDTFLDAYYQLADAGVLTAMSENPDIVVDKLVAKPDGETMVIRSLITTLETNERTKPLVVMLAKLSLSVMAENLGVSNDVLEIYDNVKDGLNAIGDIDKTQSPEEYKAAVNDVITSALTESGITEVDPDIIDSMAQQVTDKRDEVEFNEEYIDEIIFTYYDAYEEYINSSAPQP